MTRGKWRQKMDKTLYFVLALVITAGITYFIRLTPMIFIKGRIKNKFLKSFLYYVPYAVLSTLAFPAIVLTTSSPISGGAAAVGCIILAYRRKGLITCMIGGVLTVFLVGLFMMLI